MKIEAIVFDLDGVLVDAVEWHYNALNKALSFFGFEISRHAHLTTYNGLPTRVKLEMLLDELGLPRDLHPLISDLKQKFTLQIIATECRPTFKHRYMIMKLREDRYKRNRFRLAVASNAVRASVELMLKRICVLDELEFFLSNEDVFEAKPDPEIYFKAAKMLSIDPGRVLVVEDNQNGIQAAQGAGMHVCEVGTPEDLTYQLIKARIEEIER